ncbi:hypothetical protein CYMTET_43412 [Cymbomonas tetramitiformis]|uniref:FYVE-type domain-containing protein n=1 Tax=Cymbomonas tetramitiformis TaxID=36881 RepID=A0AAE0C3I2_9CHLO|nr:hypothetical protein CYMTET_43415 [Cymbomonas tetramitiformis]KAK3247084.1 hypothetical protein CYMTET_43412 [Cymbomonas tetramitiformis]|eukprot:gene9311-11030_t
MAEEKLSAILGQVQQVLDGQTNPISERGDLLLAILPKGVQASAFRKIDTCSCLQWIRIMLKETVSVSYGWKSVPEDYLQQAKLATGKACGLAVAYEVYEKYLPAELPETVTDITVLSDHFLKADTIGATSIREALSKEMRANRICINGSAHFLYCVSNKLQALQRDRQGSVSCSANHQPEISVLPPQEWQPDSARCEACGVTFGLLTRRHHCRACGRCLCHICCPKQRVAVKAGSGAVRRSAMTSTRVCAGCLQAAGAPADAPLPPATPPRRSETSSVPVGGKRAMDEQVRILEVQLAKQSSAMGIIPFAAECRAFCRQAVFMLLFAGVYSGRCEALPAVLAVLLAGLALRLLRWLLKGTLLARLVYAYALMVPFCLSMYATNVWSKRLRVKGDEAGYARVWERTNDYWAPRILGFIVQLRGLWTKFGQELSSRADIMPEVYLVLFKQLQDNVPSRPVAEIKATIEAEFGQSIDDLFEEFGEEPLASASIAQVHAARLKAGPWAGRRVVAKVQKEGVRRQMLQDMWQLKQLLMVGGWIEPDFDFGDISTMIEHTLRAELDFTQEAENMVRVKQVFAASPSPTDVVIPEVAPGLLATERVLVMDFVEGFKITSEADLEAHAVDRRQLVEDLCVGYGIQVAGGIFNADGHPGNIMVLPQVNDAASHAARGVIPRATPVLLDFGNSLRLTDRARIALCRYVVGASEMDLGLILMGLDGLGFELPVGLSNIRQFAAFVFRNTETRAEALQSHQERMAQDEKDLDALKSSSKDRGQAIHLRPPHEMLLFFRMLSLFYGLSTSLGVFGVPVLQLLAAPCAKALRAHSLQLGRPPPLPPAHGAVMGALQNTFRKLLDDLCQKTSTGAQVCIYQYGRCVVDVCAGRMGPYDHRQVRSDTLFNTMSLGNIPAAAAVHVLADQGRLDYARAVSRYWPEFGQQGKEGTTVAQMLRHQSGLQSFLPHWLGMDNLHDVERARAAIAQAVPRGPAGAPESSGPHAFCYGWLLEGLIKAISEGPSLQQVVAEQVLDPLGLHRECYLGLGGTQPDELNNCVATLHGSLVRATMPGSMPDVGQGGTDAAAPEVDVEQLLKVAHQNGIDPETLMQAGQEWLLDPRVLNRESLRAACAPSITSLCSARGLARILAALFPATASAKPAASKHAQMPLTNQSPTPPWSTNEGAECTPPPSLQPLVSDSTAALIADVAPADEHAMGFRCFRMEAPDGKQEGGPLRNGSCIHGFGYHSLGGSVAMAIPSLGFAFAITTNRLGAGEDCCVTHILEHITKELCGGRTIVTDGPR